MSSLIIKEYAATAVGSNGESMVQLAEPAAIKQAAVTFNNQSAAFTHSWIQVQADAAFRVAFGTNPVSGDLTGEFVLPANTVFTFRVQPGHKLFVNT